MTIRVVALPLLAVLAVCPAWADQPVPAAALRDVAPVLQGYTDTVLEADLWHRAGLAPRDRSLVTVAALIAAGRPEMLKAELARALDNGVKPAELGAVVTHLAFYAGWPSALSAAGVVEAVFADRGIVLDAASAATSEQLPIDAQAEQTRAAGVEKAYGAVSPSVVRYTNEVLFGDLWRRPDLAPRDRSLVTIGALIAGGHAEQLSYHLGRGMQNGLTRTEIGEVITQLAFYAGWPNALSAVPAAKAAFYKQPG